MMPKVGHREHRRFFTGGMSRCEPGVIVDAPEGAVQTTAFEIEGDAIRALYVVRNPDKLRHLGRARRERGTHAPAGVSPDDFNAE